MAFLGSVPTATLKGYGRVRFRVKALSHSTRIEPFVVKTVNDIDVEKKFFEEKVFDASGIEQLQALYQIAHGTGIFELEGEEMASSGLPGAPESGITSWTGNQTDVELCQPFPQGTKGWQYLAATANVQIVRVMPGVNGPMSRIRVRVVPYAAAGSNVYTFTKNWTPA